RKFRTEDGGLEIPLQDQTDDADPTDRFDDERRLDGERDRDLYTTEHDDRERREREKEDDRTPGSGAPAADGRKRVVVPRQEDRPGEQQRERADAGFRPRFVDDRRRRLRRFDRARERRLEQRRDL